MSIYATLWKLKFPRHGDYYLGCEWITVTAQRLFKFSVRGERDARLSGFDPDFEGRSGAMGRKTGGEADGDRG